MTYIPVEQRRQVIERAGGCCEYCRLDENDSDLAFHIEHIVAVSHGGQTAPNNLALSCPRCNFLKGANIAAADPETGDPTFLFHPRRHKWSEHFQLDGIRIEPLTAEGRVTVFLLKLNAPERVTERELLIELGAYPCETPEE